MKRQEVELGKPEVMSRLNSYRDKLLKLLEGVKVDQKGDLLLFGIPNIEAISNWNYFNIQCNGFVSHILKERCLSLGPLHPFQPSTPCDWPMSFDSTEIPGQCVTFFVEEDKLHCCSTTQLDIELPETAMQFIRNNMDKIPLNKYYLTWKLDEQLDPPLVLFSVRSRVTLELVDLHKVSIAADLSRS